MPGMKGRSGGARPNAGRKPKPQEPPPPVVEHDEADPLDFLIQVMQGKIEVNPLQLRAAIAAVQYKHTKRGEGGKKDEAIDKAKKAAAGKFKTAASPLKLVG
jgi:phage terminase small subunit